MDRRDHILKHIDTSGKGIEIAPYHSPILRKADGHDILVLDVFDTEDLRDNARKDPLVQSGGEQNIEPVDIVGDASALDTLLQDSGQLGQFDYVISSHNFEHLPDPIRFLRGVTSALKPGGVLSMAMPDYRCCFDHFRFPSRLSDWLGAYHAQRRQPSAETIFDSNANSIRFQKEDGPSIIATFDMSPVPPATLANDFRNEFDLFSERMSADFDYVDAHCNVLFPEILELFLIDLAYLGLVELEIAEISPTIGMEFFVQLRKPTAPVKMTSEDHSARRTALLRDIQSQLGSVRFKPEQSRSEEPEWRRMARRIVGSGSVEAIRNWNRARRRARRSG